MWCGIPHEDDITLRCAMPGPYRAPSILHPPSYTLYPTTPHTPEVEIGLSDRPTCHTYSIEHNPPRENQLTTDCAPGFRKRSALNSTRMQVVPVGHGLRLQTGIRTTGRLLHCPGIRGCCSEQVRERGSAGIVGCGPWLGVVTCFSWVANC